MGINIHIKDNSGAVMEQVMGQISLALDLMGEVVEGYAKDDCPVDTGLLRNSLTHAVSGVTVNTTYHADYGSNRNASGGRYSASDVNAGSVGIGSMSGQIGSANDPACYVGSNVEYAPYVEFGDYNHTTGKNHFLRDAGQDHIDELKNVAETTLSAL